MDLRNHWNKLQSSGKASAADRFAKYDRVSGHSKPRSGGVGGGDKFDRYDAKYDDRYYDDSSRSKRVKKLAASPLPSISRAYERSSPDPTVKKHSKKKSKLSLETAAPTLSGGKDLKKRNGHRSRSSDHRSRAKR